MKFPFLPPPFPTETLCRSTEENREFSQREDEEEEKDEEDDKYNEEDIPQYIYI